MSDEVEKWKKRFERERSARRQAEDLLHEKSRALYQANQELTQRADELAKSLQDLRTTQEQLVESAKLASLGRLVAGVSHEINTPLGVSMMAVAHGYEAIEQIVADIDQGKLSKKGLLQRIGDCDEALSLAVRNLKRSADLVKSFKRLAVDQSSEMMRKARLVELVNDCKMSLKSVANGKQIDVKVWSDSESEYLVDAGALVQVVTNLVQNAAIHAFDETSDSPKISIAIMHEPNRILIELEDNGLGMDVETKAKVFEPFFTTKRSEGGSGLGMHIVHNLVTQRFGGEINVASSRNHGTKWTLSLPVGEMGIQAT